MAETEAQATLDLLPAGGRPAPPEYAIVPLSALPPDEDLPGPKPSGPFVASIKAGGVHEPVVLSRQEGAGYLRVEDGRRRVKAARAAGLDAVPAVVYPAGVWRPGLLTLVAQEHRSENAVAEIAAIAALQEEGADLGAIQRATGVPLRRLRERVGLVERLIPPLSKALREGRLGARRAAQVSRLPRGQQEALAARLSEQGKITPEDVAVARRVRHQAAAAALPTMVIPVEDPREVAGRAAASAERLGTILKHVKCPGTVTAALGKFQRTLASWQKAEDAQAGKEGAA